MIGSCAKFQGQARGLTYFLIEVYHLFAGTPRRRDQKQKILSVLKCLFGYENKIKGQLVGLLVYLLRLVLC